MMAYVVLTADYNCQGCGNSYAEDIRGIFDNEEKAKKALKQLRDEVEARGFSHYDYIVRQYEIL